MGEKGLVKKNGEGCGGGELTLKVFLMSSGVFPLIMEATVAHVRSRRGCEIG